MTPISTPAETLAAQTACAEAWSASRERNGIDRLKLIHKAFPHSVNCSNAPGGLRLTWLEQYSGLGIADSGGFLTLIDDGDILQQLFHLLSLEATSPGAVRELITGEKRPKTLDTSQVPKITERKGKLSLSDLGL